MNQIVLYESLKRYVTTYGWVKDKTNVGYKENKTVLKTVLRSNSTEL